MAQCFCGCGDRAKGAGPRGANRMGKKTVAFNHDLRGALNLVVALDEADYFVGNAGPAIERLESLLVRGNDYVSFWAFFAHGNCMPSTADLLDGQREWYGWTKQVTLASRLALSEAVRAEHAVVAAAAATRAREK